VQQAHKKSKYSNLKDLGAKFYCQHALADNNLNRGPIFKTRS